MATSGQRYDHPNCVVRREEKVNNLLGLASTSMQKILFFQKTRVKAVHSLVVVAGTNAAAGVTISNGTTSVGAITHGTATALTGQTSGVLDTDIAASGYLDITGLANSATMVNSYAIECEVLQDAVHTV